MIDTDLNLPTASSALRRGLLCTALALGACVDSADLGDVPGETDAMGGTESTEGPTEGGETVGETEVGETVGETEGAETVGETEGETEGDTEGATETIGGCERVAAEPGDLHSWALICASGAAEGVEILEITPSGELLVGISSRVFEDGPTPVWEIGDAQYTHTGLSDALLLRFDATGELLWSRYFAAEEHISLRGVTLCGDDFVLAGDVSGGSVDFGEGTFEEGEFIARFGPDGALQWSRTFDVMEPSGHVTVADLHCDAAGNVAVSGTVRDGVDFGQGMLPAAVSDAFVAKFDTDGEPLFGKTLLEDSGADGGDSARAMAVAAHDDGSTYVFLDHDAAVDFGSGPIDPVYDSVGQQALLARLSDTGDLVWSAQIGGQGLVYARDLQIDADGRAVVSGPFLSFVELGEFTFGNVFPYDEQEPDLDGTNYDAYFAAFEPDGTYAWGEAVGWMRDEEAALGRFTGNQALVYRVSDRQLSVRAHSADGSGGLLEAQFEDPSSARQYGFMRANDDTVILAGAMGDQLQWPFDASAYAAGNADAIVVHFDL